MNFEDTMQSKTEREILDDLTCKWNLEKKNFIDTENWVAGAGNGWNGIKRYKLLINR